MFEKLDQPNQVNQTTGETVHTPIRVNLQTLTKCSNQPNKVNQKNPHTSQGSPN